MKNIFLIPTDNPSRIYVRNDVTPPFYSNFQGEALNIYITNDEEIKDGKNCIAFSSDDCEGELETFNNFVKYSRKPLKVVLTSDPKLETVQQLTEEQLRDFVYNPCEFVEVQKHFGKEYVDELDGFGYDIDYFSVSFPRENKKQQIIDIMKADEELGLYQDHLAITRYFDKVLETLTSGYAVKFVKQDWTFERSSGYAGYRNKETSEWIYENEYLTKFGEKELKTEKLYTEEDMERAFNVGFQVGYNDEESPSYLTFEEWIKNYKK